MLLVHKKLCQAQIGRFSKKNFNLYIFSQKFQNCVLRYICLKMRFFSFLKSYISRCNLEQVIKMSGAPSIYWALSDEWCTSH
jgi:hypothetical protein